MTEFVDTRPKLCRFRLQDEGKVYARSSCAGCGKTIMTGLGVSCSRGVAAHPTPDWVVQPGEAVPVPAQFAAPAMPGSGYDPRPVMPLLELDAALRMLARVHLRHSDVGGFVVMHGATPEWEVDRDAYTRAWEVVVKNIGGRVPQ